MSLVVPKFIQAMNYTVAEKKILTKAYYFARSAHKSQFRKSGEAYISHPVAVGKILSDWKVDVPTLQAGLLHDVLEDSLCTADEMEQIFGTTVTRLVDAVTKIGILQGQVGKTTNQDTLENVRKLLLAMSQDIRVILVKLADRLHNMRTLQHLDHERQQKKSRETLDIYAPIADRLGMGEVKAELEDLAFRYLQPEDFKNISNQAKQYIREGEALLNTIIPDILADCDAAGIKFNVAHRIKHVFSMYKKLDKYDGDFNKIRDLVALRILVPDVTSCYQVLGLIHARYKPLPHYIKDYIAVPKPNGYQSLHTTVLGMGHIFEVQIRTHEMNEYAEHGLAAHFYYDQSKSSEVYKQGAGVTLPKKYEWVQNLLEWHDDFEGDDEARSSLHIDAFNQRIFVFTPKGDLYDLPEGSTPVDFAFAVHTDLGLACRGAKVNGLIAPLDGLLENRDIVEIFAFDKHPIPNRDWLSFVVTAKARSKIKHWFKVHERTLEESAGRKILEKILSDLNQSHWDQLSSRRKNQLLESLQSKDVADLSINLYESRIRPEDIRREFKFSSQHRLRALLPQRLYRKKGPRPVALVPGIDRQFISRAGCCTPMYPQSIIGYVGRTGILKIHQEQCDVLTSEPERCLPAYWYFDSSDRLRVLGQKSLAAGILKGISQHLIGFDARAQHILKSNRQDQVIFDVNLSLVRMDRLHELISAIKRIPGVDQVDHSIRTD
ncbi:MAG: RelA/SpoT family protein [bacterium]